MMIEELAIMPEDQAISAWKSALVTFVSFFLLGGAPMLPYLFSIGHYTDTPVNFWTGMGCPTIPCCSLSGIRSADKIFWIASGIFLLTLFALGAFKVHLLFASLDTTQP